MRLYRMRLVYGRVTTTVVSTPDCKATGRGVDCVVGHHVVFVLCLGVNDLMTIVQTPSVGSDDNMSNVP